MVSDCKVLLVVPAKEEGATIEDVLRRISSEYLFLDMLVVDDVSKDSTTAVAK